MFSSFIVISIPLLISISFANLVCYLFYKPTNKSFDKKYQDFCFIKNATTDQLEAFWLTKKGKLSRKQRRYLSRLRNKEYQTESI